MDFPLQFQMNFPNPASPIAEGIIDLHHTIFFYLILILVPILWMSSKILLNSSYTWENPTKSHINNYRKNYLTLKDLVHGTTIEIIWTITPSIILMLIAMPSFALLYSIDEVIDPKFTIKVIGHQWYWSYETPDDQSFDSYMLPLSDLTPGDLRLLEVDHALICPINTHLRFIITSSDVLHSFAIPSSGIKVDAVPGRLNQVSVFINREGVYYGQCSELCGVNHGFTPIKVLALSTFVKEVVAPSALPIVLDEIVDDKIVEKVDEIVDEKVDDKASDEIVDEKVDDKASDEIVEKVVAEQPTEISVPIVSSEVDAPSALPIVLDEIVDDKIVEKVDEIVDEKVDDKASDEIVDEKVDAPSALPIVLDEIVDDKIVEKVDDKADDKASDEIVAKVDEIVDEKVVDKADDRIEINLFPEGRTRFLPISVSYDGEAIVLNREDNIEPDFYINLRLRTIYITAAQFENPMKLRTLCDYVESLGDKAEVIEEDKMQSSEWIYLDVPEDESKYKNIP